VPRLRKKPLLVIEAMLALMIASFLIKFLPFSSVAKIAAGRGIESTPAPSNEAQLIARAINVCATRVPWHAMCIQQGLAALLMLRRRGFMATLFYGAAHTSAAALVAHVWVRSADVDVVGCETANNYGLLATFPEQCN
jgi:Transglutaminase-like superfamily